MLSQPGPALFQGDIEFISCVDPGRTWQNYQTIETGINSQERRGVLVPIFRNKGNMQSYSSYRGIKLKSHSVKGWKRVVEVTVKCR